jgi:hypothetical protein
MTVRQINALLGNSRPTCPTLLSPKPLVAARRLFLAQGMDAFLAAAEAFWVHGSAAAAFGHGVLAEDLRDLLPSLSQRLYGSK